jgi:outer membrane immunogenic protein
MKKLATAIAAIASIGTPAFAADMAVKTPPPAPAPVYSWTGWYVGGNIGGGWGDANTDIAGGGTIVSFFATAIPFTNPPITVADSHTDTLTGVIGGGQLGYNYQVGPQWVLGLEADIQGSGERGSNTFNDPFSGNICFVAKLCPVTTAPITGAAVTSYEAKIEWFGTVRGRVGVLINDGLLVYGTGGLAYGHVSVSGNLNISAAATAPGVSTFGPSSNGFGQSKTNTGFAAGGGLEGRFSGWFSPNWTWKLEYLYVDLGSLDTSTSFAAAPAGGAVSFLSPLNGTMTTHTHFTDNIVRVGLNYQFH